ncbi:alpha/beta hydrolase [Gordonia jinhuaensis]|uniref:Alpha/beta hydrolase n=1 Tax=Gordonia jinhuaensis TaxID=1517702 RepID=A0A916SUN7_9ACTN|nr:alpha/beta fold hydrolase [Gordonia jinhuaensis]GGB17557.1 alpha/beta hydrolase [Gordonia jinhuaensis]
MAKVKKLMAQLARRGPHKILTGDLAVAGLPGRVYTPESGSSLPAVGLAHGWMMSSRHHAGLMEHLASWGIVVVAPDTERGPLGSDHGLAQDLSTALTVATRVRLGPGQITVQPTQVGVVGHGFGASAAVIAAATDDRIVSLSALWPASGSKDELDAARTYDSSALILAAPGELDTLPGNALALRRALTGDQVALRTVPKSTSMTFVDGYTLRRSLTGQKRNRSANRQARAALTGFILATVAEDSTYADFADPDTDLGKLVTVDPEELEDDGLDPVSRLLKA